ncbi:MAG: hypothetical protein AAF490_06720 [Chloroflexota bacterium]
MSGFFDRLQKEIDKTRADSGMRPVDLLTLSAPQRRIMRLLLREVQLTYPEITTAVSNLPDDQQLTAVELDKNLIQLTQDGWLIRMGQDTLSTYRVNLSHKPGSQVGSGMWGALNKRLKEQKDNRTK